MLKFDVSSVQRLQLLAPGVSSKDRKNVEGLVLSGEVFSNFSLSERKSIWKRMKNRKTIIPSLYTFFQDIYYLESCANCMKRLVTPQPTIRMAMRKAFSPADSTEVECLIQTSETRFRRLSISDAHRVELGYRQIWLYTMRHYRKMDKEPKNEDRVVKPGEKADPAILYDMAALAQKLGFKSPQIDQLIQLCPDRQIALEALLKARKSDRYRYNDDILESIVDRVADCFDFAIPLEDQAPRKDIDHRETKASSRCGLPQARAQRQDRDLLFIDQVHSNDFGTAQKVSTSFVRRCFYFNFFGKLPPALLIGPGHPPSISDTRISPLSVPNQHPASDVQRNEKGVFTEHKFEGGGRRARPRGQDASHEGRQQRPQEKAREPRERDCLPEQLEFSRRYSRTSLENWPTADSMHGIERTFNGRSRTELSSLSEEPATEADLEPTQESYYSTDESVENFYEKETTMAESLDQEPPAQEDQMTVDSGQDQLHDQGRVLEHADHSGPENREGSEIKRADVTAQLIEAAEDTDLAQAGGPLRTGRQKNSVNWSPYNLTQRRRRDSLSSFERPQESLEQQINTLLQPKRTRGPKRSTRPVTQVDFTETQPSPQIRIDQEDTYLQQHEGSGLTTSRPVPPETRHSTSENSPNLCQNEAPSFLELQNRDPTSATTVGVSAVTDTNLKTVEFDQAGNNKAVLPTIHETTLASLEGRAGPLQDDSPGVYQQSRRGDVSVAQKSSQRPLAKSRNVKGSPGNFPAQQYQSGDSEQPGDNRQQRHIQQPRIVTQIDFNELSETAVMPTEELFSTGDMLDIGRPTLEKDRFQDRIEDARRQPQTPIGSDGAEIQETSSKKVTIVFRERDERGGWDHVVHQMVVDPSDPSPVKRMAMKNARERGAIFYDQNLRTIPPSECFNAAVENGKNTVFVAFGHDLVMDEEMMESVSRVLGMGSEKVKEKRIKRR
jgi:hypothetical protein